MNQIQAALLAQQTLGILKARTYRDGSGAAHDLGREMDAALRGSTYYPPGELPGAGPAGSLPGQVEVGDQTTLSAAQALQQQGLNPVVLNFASPVVPGGGFQLGALAQEEYLCRNSTLYHFLRGQPLYALRTRYRAPWYSDALVHTPGVQVLRAESNALCAPWPVGVITCAAPNIRFHNVDAGQVEKIFRERIHKVLSAAHHHGHASVVLGAWGCGAFGNDARLVASCFAACLQSLGPHFEQIIFAIPEHRGSKNLQSFREVLQYGP